MRHKYDTRALVLSRAPAGETGTLFTLLTEDLGLVRARAQGIRRTGAKLAASLQTLTESEVVLVRGKEGWRLTGAVCIKNWSQTLPPEPRTRLARVIGLLLRLVAGEAAEASLFPIVSDFLRALAEAPPEEEDALEVLVALHVLAALGFDDAASLPHPSARFAPEARALVSGDRSTYVLRVNRGIAASGL